MRSNEGVSPSTATEPMHVIANRIIERVISQRRICNSASNDHSRAKMYQIDGTGRISRFKGSGRLRSIRAIEMRHLDCGRADG